MNKLLSIQKIAYFYSEKTLSKKIIINETIDDSRLNLAYHSIANIDKNLNFSLVDKKDNFINFDLYGPKKENERLSVFNQNVVSSPDKSKLKLPCSTLVKV